MVGGRVIVMKKLLLLIVLFFSQSALSDHLSKKDAEDYKLTAENFFSNGAQYSIDSTNFKY